MHAELSFCQWGCIDQLMSEMPSAGELTLTVTAHFQMSCTCNVTSSRSHTCNHSCRSPLSVTGYADLQRPCLLLFLPLITIIAMASLALYISIIISIIISIPSLYYIYGIYSWVSKTSGRLVKHLKKGKTTNFIVGISLLPKALKKVSSDLMNFHSNAGFYLI